MLCYTVYHTICASGDAIDSRLPIRPRTTNLSVVLDQENGGIGFMQKRGLFYGWIVLLGAWLAMGGAYLGSSAFNALQPAMLEELGWTRETISLAYSLNFAVLALMGPVVGAVLDRIGVRRILLIGGIVALIALGLVGFTREPWHLYLTYGVLLPIGVGLSFSLPNVVTVRRWFSKRAGLTMALLLTGSLIGVLFAAPLSSALTTTFGWRLTFFLVGLVGFVLVVVGALLVRQDPESMGLYPDGEKPDPELVKQRADYMARMVRWSLPEAIKTPTFWLLILAQAGLLVGYLAVTQFTITYAVMDLGISQERAVAIFSLAFIGVAMVSRLVISFGSDWLMMVLRGRKWVIVFVQALYCIGMLYGSTIKDATGLTIMVILTAIGAASATSLYAVLLGDLFGVVSMPQLQGVMALISQLVGAVGPWFFAHTFDSTGSYSQAFLVSGIFAVVGIIALIFMPKPVKASESASAVNAGGE